MSVFDGPEGQFVESFLDAGQTYFIGNQPVHVNFFRPEYKPQFEAARPTVSSEHIIISKDLIEEHALEELGFQYKMTVTGAYALDGRLATVSATHAYAHEIRG